MRKVLYLGVAVCLLVSLALPVMAQMTSSGDPPKVLQIYRETVKAGKGFAYENHAARFVQAFQRANSPSHWITMNSVSGANEVWYMVGYQSFADWEAKQTADMQSAVLLASMKQLEPASTDLVDASNSVVAVYRPELSHGVSSVNVPNAKFVRTTVLRIRLGTEPVFIERTKEAKAAHDRAKTGAHWFTYQVVSGMPAGTYLLFATMKSMAEADVDTGKAFQEALGEEGYSKRLQFARDNIIVVNSNLYVFNPKISRPDQTWVAANPDFWKVKTSAQVAGKKPAGTKTVPATSKAPQQ
ncbi:MAG: hypothetical protein L0387_29710 [Acidobacteria bacterium]|nr:hypothetical protein [Acidobacteriota bacterium]